MIRTVLVDIDNTLLDFDVYVEESLKKGFEKSETMPAQSREKR